MRKKVRKEVHSRSIFAHDMAVYLFNRAVKESIVSKGNICSCKMMRKYSQARRIYIHYTNEYQINQNLPITK